MRKPRKSLDYGERKGDKHESFRECPVFLTLSLIANKWSVRILYYLLHAEGRTLRFGQLQKQLDGITQRELTKHLREFERAGIVTRTVFPQVPPRVDYTLTDIGESLWKPIEELSRWAEKNGALIQKHCKLHESSDKK